MAKTRASDGPWNWFFLNHNQCAQGCSMPNFTILGVSHSPLSLKMAKMWPFYGQNMVLIWSFNLVLPESLLICPGMIHAKFQNTGCIKYSPFTRNGQNTSLIWPKDGPQNWVFLNLNHCAKGCSMPNFTLPGLSCCPLS